MAGWKRRLVVAVLAFGSACGGGGRTTAPTPPPSAAPTTVTTADVCLRVSTFFAEQKLKPVTSARLGATEEDGGHWYVANADGAVWLTTIDPSSGEDLRGEILPLNDSARAASSFGSDVPYSDPRYQGYSRVASRAIDALDCSRR